MWNTTLATPGSRGRGSSNGSRGFLASSSQSSGGSSSRPNECTFCQAPNHRLLTCPIRVCKHCRQRGPSHYRFDCPNNPTRRDTRPQSTTATATAGVSFTISTSPTLIDVSDLLALIQQILLAFGNPSIALSASTGSADGTDSWSPLSSSSTPPYLTDPSIELFPEDVDIPADLPDDTLHVAPLTIVYPVESSSTNPAPPVPPPVHLPSDLLVRRSTRAKYASDLLTRAGLSDCEMDKIGIGNVKTHEEHSRKSELNEIFDLHETNIMTQGELDRLKKSCSFPSGIQIRLPEADETIASTRPGEVAFYEVAFYEVTFQADLSLSIHPTIRRILAYYNICPAQLSNAWQSIYPASPIHPIDAMARPKKTLLGGGTLAMSKGGRIKFFFISGDNWEFAHRQSRELVVSRVPTSWRTLMCSTFSSKRCNELPVLTEVEQEGFDQISGKLEQGQHYPIKDVFFSKSFLYSFGLKSRKMASSGGDNAEEKSVGDTAHVAAEEGESRLSQGDLSRGDHSRDDS
ncbi:hypothetical protein Acr_15g0008590 [Actinidia rufa]|uniref:Uncharacterized protein n=1 Tax=Actinidia rufa TaxID=165716 RepID=A0A7J0FU91_9ERIC|nr:hypothetical protein Acr_15g0008590 [Actinidia rufa]